MSSESKKYRCLKTNIFSSGQYTIVPIRYEDRSKIMQWRNEQIHHLRQNKLLTNQDQENYFLNVVAKLYSVEQPRQILFSYLYNDQCIGYGGLVHVNWIDKHAEISFIMATELEEINFIQHWGTYLELIEKVAFKELELHKIFTYAFDIRPHLYEAVEAKGFKKEAVLKDHCLFHNEYKDVVIHSKLNKEHLNIIFRKLCAADKLTIYEWSNEEVARSNSFNSTKISFNDHEKWFDRKLKDESALYFICEVGGLKAALVRFDLNESFTLVGINIDKKFRGMGLSSIILEQATKKYFSTNILKLVAYIKISNIASIKAFEKAGFKFHKNTSLNDENALEYLLENK